MMEFKTYNQSMEWFEILYNNNQQDLIQFINAIDEITSDTDDPFTALAEAIGVDPNANNPNSTDP